MAYDVVVVGGGTAGCALAARLSEDPTRSICLVEAGPDYGSYTDGRWPDDILDGRWLALDSHRWEQDDEDDRSQARARILGGCSAHNACVVLRGADTDYDEWGDGWTAAALRPYLDRAEGMLRTRVLEERELHPWQRAFAGAAGADTIVHPVNMTENGVRWTTAFAYIDPARDRPNLTILPDTLVGRVLLEGERAAGVNTFAGQLEAGMVVLAAGADPGYEISAAAFAMKPRSRGRVTLSSPDARVPLRIEHGFLRDEADVPVLVEGFEWLRALGRREPIRRYAAREIRPGEDVGAEAHVRATARGFFHPTGTSALGSVVDARGRVLGYENLMVADASIMPTIPRANTNLTTAAIAEKLAETI